MTADSRRRDPEATRAAILDAAEALFLADGLADTPTSAVARQAGVTKSLIHHHFGSKEQLWSEVKERRFREYYQQQTELLQAADAGTAETLRQSMLAYFRFLEHNPDMVRVMAWRFIEGDDVCMEEERELMELGSARIAEAQARGELRTDLDPLYIIKAFIALCQHWFQTKGLLCQMIGPEDGRTDDERYLQHALTLFLDGVRPR